jgi:hypothetical protein
MTVSKLGVETVNLVELHDLSSLYPGCIDPRMGRGRAKEATVHKGTRRN